MQPTSRAESTAAATTRAGTGASWLQRLALQEDLNFLLTNRIPRRLATRFMGWFSKLPTGPLTRATIAV
jgi:phosphatidylserine decarboxylase